MTDERGLRRRACLAGALAVLGVGAGCSADASVGERAPDEVIRPDCAREVSIHDRASGLGAGEVPEVRFRLRNGGETRVAYEITVLFEQSTSLGIEARTGRAVVSGEVPPGERVTTVASVAPEDAPDIRNTDSYRVEVVLSCPER